MSKVFDFLPDSLFQIALPFSLANHAAGTSNILTLAQGNGYVVPPEYVFHPIALQGKVNASPAAEKLANGGFETAGEGGADVFGSWTETAGNGAIASEAGAGNFHGGAKSAKLTTGADTLVKLVQAITVIPGYTYEFSFWVKGDGETNKAQYELVDSTNSDDIVAKKSVATASEVFYKVTETFEAPEDCVEVTISLFGSATEGAICYLDDVSAVCTICPEKTGVFKIAQDGVALTEGPQPAIDDFIGNDFAGAHVDFYPITAGKVITVLFVTTANYLPVTADADAILYGVLKHA